MFCIQISVIIHSDEFIALINLFTSIELIDRLDLKLYIVSTLTIAMMDFIIIKKIIFAYFLRRKKHNLLFIFLEAIQNF